MGFYTLQGIRKGKRFEWYLGVAFVDWPYMWITWALIRVRSRWKCFFKRGILESFWVEIDHLLPHKASSREASCPPWPGLGTFAKFPALIPSLRGLPNSVTRASPSPSNRAWLWVGTPTYIKREQHNMYKSRKWIYLQIRWKLETENFLIHVCLAHNKDTTLQKRSQFTKKKKKS